MGIASLSTGLSGRTLRKIPFLAHANYLQCGEVKMFNYLEAMRQSIGKVFGDKRALKSGVGPVEHDVMFAQKPELELSKEINDINDQIFTEEIKENLERGDLWHHMLALSAAYRIFIPEGVNGHIVLNVKGEEIVKISKRTIKIDASKVLQNWDTRQIPRFKYEYTIKRLKLNKILFFLQELATFASGYRCRFSTSRN